MASQNHPHQISLKKLKLVSPNEPLSTRQEHPVLNNISNQENEQKQKIQKLTSMIENLYDN